MSKKHIGLIIDPHSKGKLLFTLLSIIGPLMLCAVILFFIAIMFLFACATMLFIIGEFPSILAAMSFVFLSFSVMAMRQFRAYRYGIDLVEIFVIVFTTFIPLTILLAISYFLCEFITGPDIIPYIGAAITGCGFVFLCSKRYYIRKYWIIPHRRLLRRWGLCVFLIKKKIKLQNH